MIRRERTNVQGQRILALIVPALPGRVLRPPGPLGDDVSEPTG